MAFLNKSFQTSNAFENTKNTIRLQTPIAVNFSEKSRHAAI